MAAMSQEDYEAAARDMATARRHVSKLFEGAAAELLAIYEGQRAQTPTLPDLPAATAFDLADCFDLSQWSIVAYSAAAVLAETDIAAAAAANALGQLYQDQALACFQIRL